MSADENREWSKEYIEEKYGDNYAAARRSIAKYAKDIDEEFKLLEQLGLL